MAILNLVLYPDDPLTKIAKPFNGVGADAARLAADMFETMYAHDGVGLAGPQVGVSKRVIVLHEPEGKALCLINPEISELEGQETSDEGCLSLPDVFAPVERATRIRVQALDASGGALDFEANGLLARIIQHETDHLDGIVFIDRVDILTRQAKLQELREARGKRVAALFGS